MKYPIKLLLTGSLTTLLLTGITGCMKAEYKNEPCLTKLYNRYKNGEITECRYQGQTVYSAARNAYDAGSAIYDINGNQIGTCNFAWGQPDSICFALTDCETIYCVKDNIWGKPAVDKYGLGK